MYSSNQRDPYPEGCTTIWVGNLLLHSTTLSYYMADNWHHYQEQDTLQEFNDGEAQPDALRWLELRSSNQASCLSYPQIRCWAMRIKTVQQLNAGVTKITLTTSFHGNLTQSKRYFSFFHCVVVWRLINYSSCKVQHFQGQIQLWIRIASCNVGIIGLIRLIFAI